MKELSTEEKAKRYDKALERARIWKDKSGMPKDKQGILDDIFPELKDSEDEKIKKEIACIIRTAYWTSNRDRFNKLVDWLEKQGEQKPAWSEDDEDIFNDIIEDITPYGECPDYPTDEERKYFYEGDRKVNWLKSLKDRVGCEVNCATTWKPSDEQIEALEHFIRSVGESGYVSPYDNNTKLLYSLLGQLKKLREE